MRWKCSCAYDGTHYAGWQTQNGQESVQEVIETAIEAIVKHRIVIHGSGRTDAGVHALEQVFHFDYDWKHGGERLVKAVSTKLPRSIKLLSATPVDEEFHARFSAVSKRYHYRLFLGDADPFLWPYCLSVPRQLDLNVMKRGMDLLVGEHDFAAFAANRGLEYESTVRQMKAVELTLADRLVLVSFEANGFMYKMVRSLVGSLLNVGLGRLALDDLQNLLESRQRTPLVEASPARGLFLEKVFYA
ncbi:tRNA pseudouridine(38-40) synthase TruA [Pelagicoccus sp. SDUM812003]|uniref:tRNA pseudouridine(38-40) synthase TruA n=1 Tax=Pelagicoccus sp. SDUM812003 TaxID=3041267 RepID=UPI00280EC0A7|nr:tRNA pseudouridine(38-40) synthase TruA [Pelagicoccus sp. SDUM812003]MDQ8203326.1 tRNA pseudouridine(38-40) synthase TruA [Pelagicoccus sp. SDUM812003]